MNEFTKLVAADRRLTLLRLLLEDADYSHNEYVLRSGLSAMGHGVSRDLLRTDLAWLAEQGLVDVREAAEGLKVARLLARGRDAAEGAVVVPGVKRPEPGI